MNINQLRLMQSLPLKIKYLKTKQRIKEWYEYHNGDVYVSFSGGKDSTVLLDIVRRIYPDVVAVFSDTGLEYPEIREFVKSIDNIIWVKSDKNFKDVIIDEGYPVISKANALYLRQAKTLSKDSKSYKLRMFGYNSKTKKYQNFGKIPNKYKYLVDNEIKISEKCCNIIKKNPIKEFENKNKLKPFIGMLASESFNRQKEYLRRGCNSFSGTITSNPLGFWTTQDILRYIYIRKISISKIYGNIRKEKGKYILTGEQRTGCMFCMFGCHLENNPNRFQRMRKTHPKIYEYCMKPINEGGLGIKQVLELLNIKYK